MQRVGWSIGLGPYSDKVHTAETGQESLKVYKVERGNCNCTNDGQKTTRGVGGLVAGCNNVYLIVIAR